MTEEPENPLADEAMAHSNDATVVGSAHLKDVLVDIHPTIVTDASPGFVVDIDDPKGKKFALSLTFEVPDVGPQVAVYVFPTEEAWVALIGQMVLMGGPEFRKHLIAFLS